MANRDECFSCEHLVKHCIKTDVKRDDGSYETAAWFSCARRKQPLPTITKYDLPGCCYYTSGQRQVVWEQLEDNA